MSTPEAIIVYRNPLEASLWQFLSDGGSLYFFMVLLAVVAFVGGAWLFEKINRHYRSVRFRNEGKIQIVIGLAFDVGTMAILGHFL